jgi:hypothetical protein
LLAGTATADLDPFVGDAGVAAFSTGGGELVGRSGLVRETLARRTGTGSREAALLLSR